MHTRQKTRLRLRLTFRLIVMLGLFSILTAATLFMYFNFGSSGKVYAGTETLSTGSYIINMGVSPQTINNSLRPYGMVYDLMVNYNVPIKWIIEPTKSKDGTDFTYGGVNYKGGCFIVPKEYITSNVTTRITYWAGKGINGLYTTSALSVPVYATITVWPRLIIDDVSGNSGIITNYFDNAMIPAAGYSIGTPSLLTYCHDMWANPHGDPTWATHGYLYNLATTARSYIWMQCHAVSVTEGIQNPSAPFERLNFLTTTGLKCYSAGKCVTAAEVHAGNPTTPYTHYYPTDPIMQFLGTMDGATGSGSEQWYQPQSTGAWRPNTKLLVTTSDGSGTGQGVVMVCGPAFGDTTNGYVMYEAGHNIDGSGNTAEKVAAQRAFFNFLLFAGIKKQISFNAQMSPSSLIGNDSGSCAVTVSGGSTPYTYSWSSTVGGSFGNASSSSTYFKAPVVASTTTGTLICTVTDACSRKNFVSRPITINTGVLPIQLKSFKAKFENNVVEAEWITSSEINNSYFTIERSSDGITFEEIGRLEGSGNSTTDKNYSFIDPSPVQQMNYYRLKQTDFDGSTETFDPVFVKIDFRSAGFEVANSGPNPFEDHFNITFTGENSDAVNYSLLNQSGLSLRSGEITSARGMNSFTLENLADLPAGVYYLLIICNEDKKIIKLLKS